MPAELCKQWGWNSGNLLLIEQVKQQQQTMFSYWCNTSPWKTHPWGTLGSSIPSWVWALRITHPPLVAPPILPSQLSYLLPASPHAHPSSMWGCLGMRIPTPVLTPWVTINCNQSTVTLNSGGDKLSGRPWWLSGKEFPSRCRRHGFCRPLGWEDHWEKGMATHSSVLSGKLHG